MNINFMIRDLSAFELLDINKDVASKQIFIYGGNIRVNTFVNNFPLTVAIARSAAPVAIDEHLRPSRPLVVSMPVRLRVRPVGQPLALENVDISGWLLPGEAPSLGCFLKDGKRPDRLSLKLDDMLLDFHDRKYPFGWPEWEIDWLNEHGEPVLTLTRTS